MSLQSNYFKEAQKLVPDFLGVLLAIISISIVWGLAFLIASTSKIALSDYIQLAIFVFIAGTMFVGIWTHRRNEEFRRSETFLSNAVELINRARSVLTTKDGELTNNRVCWVTAARLLTRALQISAQISNDAHQKIFEAEHDYHRHDFGNLFMPNGQQLPASFFVGASNISLSLGNVIHSASTSGNEISAGWIPPRVIAVVYRFFQYPEGYEDPLNTSEELTRLEKNRLWLFKHHGVCDYLTFRKHFVPVGTQVFKINTSSGKNTLVASTQIDLEMASLSGLEED
jgi:hypothetical protein